MAPPLLGLLELDKARHVGSDWWQMAESHVPGAIQIVCLAAAHGHGFGWRAQWQYGDNYMPNKARTPIEPRGLSLIQAATYIGVSATFFAGLVREGRMPAAKHVGSRRIWDRWKLDAAFDELGEEEDARNPWDGVLQPTAFIQALAETPRSDEERMREVRRRLDIEWYGRSTEGLSDAEIQGLEDERRARWENQVRSSPLDKRERAALPRLYELRHRMVAHSEIKGAGPGTQDRLAVRGYAVITRTAERFIGWQITPEGERVFLAGEATQ